MSLVVYDIISDSLWGGDPGEYDCLTAIKVRFPIYSFVPKEMCRKHYNIEQISGSYLPTVLYAYYTLCKPRAPPQICLSLLCLSLSM